MKRAGHLLLSSHFCGNTRERQQCVGLPQQRPCQMTVLWEDFVMLSGQAANSEPETLAHDHAEPVEGLVLLIHMHADIGDVLE